MKNKTLWQPIYKVFSIIGIILILVTSIQSSAAYAASSSNTPTPTPTPTRIQGDLNGDGKVDVLDLILLQMSQSGLKAPDLSQGLTINDLINIILGLTHQGSTGGGGGGGGGGAVSTQTPTPTPTPVLIAPGI